MASIASSHNGADGGLAAPFFKTTLRDNVQSVEEEALWLKDLELRTRCGEAITADEAEKVLSLMFPEAIWVVRMLVARMLPRLALTDHQSKESIQFLRLQAVDSNAFVRAWALYSLAIFAQRVADIRPEVVRMLELALGSEGPAVKARAREGLRVLDT